MSRPKDSVQLTTLLRPEAKREIEAVARRRNMPMQDVLRQALAAWLEADAILQEQERERERATA